jgi:hypothetical protein
MLALLEGKKRYRCKTIIKEQHLDINKLEIPLSGQLNISTLSGHYVATMFQKYVAT